MQCRYTVVHPGGGGLGVETLPFGTQKHNLILLWNTVSNTLLDLFYFLPEVGKAQLPQLRKMRCALIFYFETLRKLRCGQKSLKIVAL